MKILLNDELIQEYLQENKTQEIVYIVELDKNDSVKSPDVTNLIVKCLDVLNEQPDTKKIKLFISVE